MSDYLNFQILVDFSTAVDKGLKFELKDTFNKKKEHEKFCSHCQTNTHDTKYCRY